MPFKHLACVATLVGVAMHLIAQDTLPVKPKILELSMGTFNTVSTGNNVSVNPAISGSFADYIFDNRYNYETANSASINIGKRIFKRLKNIEVLPMTGFIFGSFKGITAELQVSADYPLWALSTDNQYSTEYTSSGKRLFFNWSTARYKLTSFLRVGISTFLDNEPHQEIIFDKGLTASLAVKKMALRFYAFNIGTEKRYYWIALRYNFKIKIIN